MVQKTNISHRGVTGFDKAWDAEGQQPIWQDSKASHYNATGAWYRYLGILSTKLLQATSGSIAALSRKMYKTLWIGGWISNYTITNPPSVNDFQVRVVVNYISGKMNSDFSDLTFWQSGVKVPFFIASKTNGVSAECFFKAAASLTTFQVKHFPSPGVTSESNGTNTFDWFDTFANLNNWDAPSGWSSDGDNAVCSASDWGNVMRTTVAAWGRASGVFEVYAINGGNVSAYDMNINFYCSDAVSRGAQWGSGAVDYIWGSGVQNWGEADTRNWFRASLKAITGAQAILINNVQESTNTQTYAYTLDGFSIRSKGNSTWAWVGLRKYAATEPTCSYVSTAAGTEVVLVSLAKKTFRWWPLTEVVEFADLAKRWTNMATHAWFNRMKFNRSPFNRGIAMIMIWVYRETIELGDNVSKVIRWLLSVTESVWVSLARWKIGEYGKQTLAIAAVGVATLARTQVKWLTEHFHLIDNRVSGAVRNLWEHFHLVDNIKKQVPKLLSVIETPTAKVIKKMKKTIAVLGGQGWATTFTISDPPTVSGCVLYLYIVYQPGYMNPDFTGLSFWQDGEELPYNLWEKTTSSHARAHIKIHANTSTLVMRHQVQSGQSDDSDPDAIYEYYDYFDSFDSDIWDTYITGNATVEQYTGYIRLWGDIGDSNSIRIQLKNKTFGMGYTAFVNLRTCTNKHWAQYGFSNTFDSYYRNHPDDITGTRAVCAYIANAWQCTNDVPQLRLYEDTTCYVGASAYGYGGFQWYWTKLTNCDDGKNFQMANVCDISTEDDYGESSSYYFFLGHCSLTCGSWQGNGFLDIGTLYIWKDSWPIPEATQGGTGPFGTVALATIATQVFEGIPVAVLIVASTAIASITRKLNLKRLLAITETTVPFLDPWKWRPMLYKALQVISTETATLTWKGYRELVETIEFIEVRLQSVKVILRQTIKIIDGLVRPSYEQLLTETIEFIDVTFGKWTSVLRETIELLHSRSSAALSKLKETFVLWYHTRRGASAIKLEGFKVYDLKLVRTKSYKTEVIEIIDNFYRGTIGKFIKVTESSIVSLTRRLHISRALSEVMKFLDRRVARIGYHLSVTSVGIATIYREMIRTLSEHFHIVHDKSIKATTSIREYVKIIDRRRILAQKQLKETISFIDSIVHVFGRVCYESIKLIDTRVAQMTTHVHEILNVSGILRKRPLKVFAERINTVETTIKAHARKVAAETINLAELRASSLIRTIRETLEFIDRYLARPIKLFTERINVLDDYDFIAYIRVLVERINVLSDRVSRATMNRVEHFHILSTATRSAVTYYLERINFADTLKYIPHFIFTEVIQPIENSVRKTTRRLVEHFHLFNTLINQLHIYRTLIETIKLIDRRAFAYVRKEIAYIADAAFRHPKGTKRESISLLDSSFRHSLRYLREHIKLRTKRAFGIVKTETIKFIDNIVTWKTWILNEALAFQESTYRTVNAIRREVIELENTLIKWPMKQFRETVRLLAQSGRTTISRVIAEAVLVGGDVLSKVRRSLIETLKVLDTRRSQVVVAISSHRLWVSDRSRKSITRSVAERLNIASTLAPKVFAILRETITVLEASTRAVTRSLMEVVKFYSILKKTPNKVLSEVMTSVDNLSYSLAHILTEVLTFTDSIAQGVLHVYHVLLEGVTFVDNTARSFIVRLRERVVVIDNWVRHLVITRVLVEVARIVDRGEGFMANLFRRVRTIAKSISERTRGKPRG